MSQRIKEGGKSKGLKVKKEGQREKVKCCSSWLHQLPGTVSWCINTVKC